MSRKEKKYHYIYKTTNLKTGMFYIGMHSTDNLNDGYLGSGTRLRRSIRKNGIINFKLEIIEFLPDRISLKKREKELVNEELIKEKMCMNLKPGGGGGFVNEKHRNKFLLSSKTNGAIEKGRDKIKELRKDKDWVKWHSERVKEGKLKKNGYKPTFKGKSHTEETKNKMRISKIGKTPINKGKKMTEIQKNKISESLKNHFKNNPKPKKFWITNGLINKMLTDKNEIPLGWFFGRTIK
jgi:hypothetical protein